MTKTLLASVKLRDCHLPRKLVDGPAFAVVVSMMRFGWQVFSGTEFGTHKEVLSFASVGASRRVWQMDLGARGDQNLGTGPGWRTASHCSTQACCAALACVGRTPGTGRAAVCVRGHDAHAESGVVGTVFAEKIAAASFVEHAGHGEAALPAASTGTSLWRSVAFLWSLRHVGALGGTFCSDSLKRQKAVHLRVNL